MGVVYYLFYLDHFFKDSLKSAAFLNIGWIWNFTWEHAAPGQSVNTLGDKLQQHVAVTRRSDKSLRVVWRMFVKIFVPGTDFCRCNQSQKIKSDWIRSTCCGNKILLQRQKFLQKFSGIHEAICRCYNLSPSMHRLCLSNNSPTPLLIGGLLLRWLRY